jgi:hypothetical protein
LPYHILNVDSNDRIFIGNDAFKKDCNGLMDYCFDQILEIIQKLDEAKAQYYPVLFQITMKTANLLISNCLMTKKIESLINKMFKMADGYMTENNKTATEKITRNLINLTFESFKKKKESQATILQNY